MLSYSHLSLVEALEVGFFVWFVVVLVFYFFQYILGYMYSV